MFKIAIYYLVFGFDCKLNEFRLCRDWIHIKDLMFVYSILTLEILGNINLVMFRNNVTKIEFVFTLQRVAKTIIPSGLSTASSKEP